MYESLDCLITIFSCFFQTRAARATVRAARSSNAYSRALVTAVRTTESARAKWAFAAAAAVVASGTIAAGATFAGKTSPSWCFLHNPLC